MKKYAPIILAVFFPLIAVAAYGVITEKYTLPENETFKENTYIVAGEAMVNGKINEDLAIATGAIYFNGEILGDAILLAGQTDIYGKIKGDARLLAGKTTVGGEIGGDLVVGGGSVVILPKAEIGGEVIIGAGEATVAGTIQKGISFKGGRLTINGSVSGPVYFEGEVLTLGDDASITGDLHYNADAELIVSKSAVIEGEQKVEAAVKAAMYWRSVPTLFVGLASAAFLIRFAGLLLAALLLAGLFKKFTNSFVLESFNRFGKSFLIGAAAAILIPIIALILIVSLFGACLGFFLLAVAALLCMLAYFMSAIFLGSLILKVLTKGGEIVADWRAVLVGVLAQSILCFVPFVGPILLMVIGLASAGALLRLCHQKIWLVR
ncbi:MAG: polymer-forming cytoskeletal protein [Candidatus Paceibacterota bacterium]|jgi:cytoskeletal protein CcmA (bactofilin family)